MGSFSWLRTDANTNLRFCHQGFDIEFNFTQEELEERIESLKKEIEKTWEDDYDTYDDY